MSNLYLRQDLDSSEQMMVDAEVTRSKKDKTIVILLWLFLATVGAQRFYLKDTGYAIMLILFGWATLFIWPLVDIFFALKRLEQYNNKIEEDAIMKVKAMRPRDRVNPMQGQVWGSTSATDFAGPASMEKE